MTYIVRKKPQYPDTYEECCKVFGLNHFLSLAWDSYDVYSGVIKYLPKQIEDIAKKLELVSKLIICRNAYWKIAGEQMGLGKPWEYDMSKGEYSSAISYQSGFIQKNEIRHSNAILVFPTEEMRDTFYKNFKDLIETCKEFL